MSAYIVDDETIYRAVTLLKRHSGREHKFLTDKETVRLAQQLFALNVRAVRARYADADEVGMIPAAFDAERVLDYRHSGGLLRLIKSAQCLHYQCSEGDVPNLPLYRRLNRAIGDACEDVVSSLAEWQALPWD